MKTIEITLYQFNELTEEAQQKAIKDFRENQYKHGEYLMFFQDNCNEILSEKGFSDTEITYSLSYSQGDGLSFSAKEYSKLESLFLNHLGKGKEKTAKLIAENCDLKINKNDGHYCYARKQDIDLYFDYSSENLTIDFPNIDSIVEKVLSELEDIYIDICKTLEENGYSEIEYQNSDENIIESIKANEYDFTENGELY